MGSYACGFYQCKVSGNRHRFRCFGNRWQSKTCAHRPLMHAAVSSQPWIVRLNEHRYIKGGGILHCAAHQQSIAHGISCITHSDAASTSECGHVGERFTAESGGQCTERENANSAVLLCIHSDHVCHSRSIHHRLCIRLNAHCSNAACDGCH